MSGGVLRGEQIYLGYNAGSSGEIEISGGRVAAGKALRIGYSGAGLLRQTGGTVSSVDWLHVAHEPDGQGRYELQGGECSGRDLEVGEAGTGTFLQSGGTCTVEAEGLDIGRGSTASGVYTLTGGTLKIVDGSDNYVCVGREGGGTLNLGDPSSVGLLTDNGGSIDVVVRKYSNGSGTVRGWSRLGDGTNNLLLGGTLENNGRVIADGYGDDDHVLDMTNFGTGQNVSVAVDNTIENFDHPYNEVGPAGNGWFAQDHGKLILPAIAVETGSNAYNWGEAPSDIDIDLINSLRLTFRNVSTGGDLTISLLAPERAEVTAKSAGMDEDWTIVSAWKFDASPVPNFDTLDLALRYDHTHSAIQGADDERCLLLLQWDPDAGQGGAWVRLRHDKDLDKKQITNLLVNERVDERLQDLAATEYFAVVRQFPGDADADCDVDVFDAIILTNAFGSQPGDENWDERADFDSNGIVDVFDSIVLTNHFGQSCGGGEAAAGGEGGLLAASASAGTAGIEDRDGNGIADGCDLLRMLDEMGVTDQVDPATLERLQAQCTGLSIAR